MGLNMVPQVPSRVLSGRAVALAATKARMISTRKARAALRGIPT